MDGKLLALGTLAGTVKVFETKHFELKHKLEGPTDGINDL